MVQLIEAPGFLQDKADENSMVSTLSVEELEDREAAVEGRMKRKILALRRLFDAGISEVIIADGRRDHPVLDALDGKGTTVR